MNKILVDWAAVDNSRMDYEFTCKEFVECFTGNDFAAPPRVLRIHATTSDGKKVCVSVPYDDRGSAIATIDGE